MRSGKFHKIGRSNDPGRRRYEIGTKTPEPAELVHELRTDDPVGIERYWHNRFAEKHSNGEWYKLTRRDVRAFTSRGESM